MVDTKAVWAAAGRQMTGEVNLHEMTASMDEEKNLIQVRQAHLEPEDSGAFRFLVGTYSPEDFDRHFATDKVNALLLFTTRETAAIERLEGEIKRRRKLHNVALGMISDLTAAERIPDDGC